MEPKESSLKHRISRRKSERMVEEDLDPVGVDIQDPQIINFNVYIF